MRRDNIPGPLTASGSNSWHFRHWPQIKNIKTRLNETLFSICKYFSSGGAEECDAVSRTQDRHIWRQTGPAGAHSSQLRARRSPRAVLFSVQTSPMIGWGWLLFCCVDMHRDEQTDGGMCYTCPENIWGQGKLASIYTNNDQHPSFVRLFHVIIDACVRKL